MTEKRVKANEKQKKSVREVMKELFNVTSASDDDDAIMKSFLGYASNLKNDLEKLEIHYSTQPAYPGKQVVASGKKLMTEVLQMKYSNEFFTGVDRKKDDYGNHLDRTCICLIECPLSVVWLITGIIFML